MVRVISIIEILVSVGVAGYMFSFFGGTIGWIGLVFAVIGIGGAFLLSAL